ncbi:DeoR/GlpR family DNA-binding transcription regulator [Telluribacter sp.]|jgi:DeoR family fructose operon transcriptional repressor|uniref:DeoR/GlpR family DNA-binding transcription regulator n=1 Tax=Telluribacter sp. TaxID=1978767 RepID=UPI002E158F72|nr:DeoR/GlpR family DNA-binding transcription regulator [Telluribacter sp.]
MSFQNRKNKILTLVEAKGEVDVRELAQALETSEITVRRDLTSLAADGLVLRTHGGAMKVEPIRGPVDFAHKAAVNAEQKDGICRVAAQEIQEGEVIFMDCGSTVFRLGPFIRNKKIKVITNSLPVVYELMGSQVSVNLVGGEVDPERLAVHGKIAEEHIARYRADRAFLGVDGISPGNGLSAHSEKEASMTLAVAAQATYTYLLCDASKLGKDKYLRYAPLTLAQVLITNADEELLQPYREKGIRIIRSQ